MEGSTQGTWQDLPALSILYDIGVFSVKLNFSKPDKSCLLHRKGGDTAFMNNLRGKLEYR
jgi:hypothetical protein